PERPHNPPAPTAAALAVQEFGLFPVRSPLLRESSLFLGVLRCFSSPGSLLLAYVFSQGCPPITAGALPHSDIHGSLRACRSPWRFAACRVLPRPRAPRHPPQAPLCLSLAFMPLKQPRPFWSLASRPEE